MTKDGLFCNARSKCCCRHGQNQCFLEDAFDTDGVCWLDGRRAFLRMKEKEAGCNSTCKCCCLRYKFEDRLEKPCEEGKVFCLNSCRFFPLICQDKTELEGMSGEHGFISCIERSLCILGTCSVVPKKFFVECCGSRVMGSPKEAQALPQNEPQPEAEATVTFGGASFGHDGNRAMEGEIRSMLDQLTVMSAG